MSLEGFWMLGKGEIQGMIYIKNAGKPVVISIKSWKMDRFCQNISQILFLAIVQGNEIG